MWGRSLRARTAVRVSRWEHYEHSRLNPGWQYRQDEGWEVQRFVLIRPDCKKSLIRSQAPQQPRQIQVFREPGKQFEYHDLCVPTLLVLFNWRLASSTNDGCDRLFMIANGIFLPVRVPIGLADLNVAIIAIDRNYSTCHMNGITLDFTAWRAVLHPSDLNNYKYNRDKFFWANLTLWNLGFVNLAERQLSLRLRYNALYGISNRTVMSKVQRHRTFLTVIGKF